MYEEDAPDYGDWDPQKAQRAVDAELAMLDKTPEEMAKERIRSAAPLAAQSIIHLSNYALKEEIRLRASMYIVDRAMGRITDEPIVSVESEFEKLTNEIVVVE